MSGLILIGELLIVPLCIAVLVDVIAWLQRDRDEPPRHRPGHDAAHGRM